MLIYDYGRTDRYMKITSKPINNLLFLLLLALCHSAIAQADGKVGNIKAQLATVNAQIETIKKENDALKAKLAETQKEIDDLKRASEEKTKAFNALKEKAAAAKNTK